MKAVSLAWTLAAAVSLLGACRKRAEPAHRTEPWLAHPSGSASLPAALPHSFYFDHDSRVRFSIAGRKAKVSGSAPVSAGSLEMDPQDLTRASASVTVDLGALEVDGVALPPGVELGGASPSEVARRWLELGAKVQEEKRQQFAIARFELSAVEGWSGVPLDLSRRGRPGSRATAVGTLLLHGYRAPVRAEVILTPETSGDALPRIAIRSASELVLPLSPHDIGPRGPEGLVDTVATARALESLGKNLRLSLELVAKPRARPSNPP